MAVEYSLLTWAGLGTTVTFTDVGDVVNMTAHGAPNGHAFRFTTTGALPTGLTAGTTYYLRAGADANKFLVYPTQADAIAGTNQVTFSGTGSGTHMVVGEYWSALGTEARARYGSEGSERVYSSLSYWERGLSAVASPTKQTVLEIQGKWDDLRSTYSAGHTLTGYFSVVLTTKINGVYDPDSYHGGKISGGYRRIDSYNTAGNFVNTGTQLNVEVDGIEFVGSAVNSSAIIGSAAYTVKNCIIKATSHGLAPATGNCLFYNNLIYDCGGTGIKFNQYDSGTTVYNNTVVGCSVGIQGVKAYTNHCIGNVCYGNTINWDTAPSGGYWANNAGATGDTIWTTSGQSNITGLTSADFSNYVVPVTSLSNFSPSGDSTSHTSSSKLVDMGAQLIGSMIPSDIAGNLRPSYKNGSATNWDIGAYEFDWGYGPAPSSVNISITGMASGSEIAIYKASDMSAILAPQSTTGSYSGTYTYTGDTNIIVRVRKGTAAIRYLPYEYAGTITSTGFQLVVSQIPDTIAQ